MIKSYRMKSTPVQAIQFKYDPECILELQEFCGPALGLYGKEWSDTAQGWVHIKSKNAGEVWVVKSVAKENDWIVKCDDQFFVYNPDIFKRIYEEV